MRLISRRTLALIAGATALGTALGACSSVTVHTDWNTALDFQTFKTYAWLPDTVDKHLSPFAQQRLKAAIDAELVKHGMHEAASDPDLYVTFRANASSRTQYTTVSSGYGYGGGWGGWGYYGGYGYGGVGVSTTSSQQIPTGNLIIAIVDPKANQLVWRGSAKADISDDPEERASQLKDAMNQLFAQFPPKKGQKPGDSQY